MTSDLSSLLRPNVVGCYTHFEITEVFLSDTKEQCTKNVFTILVAEERKNNLAIGPIYLSKKPTKIKGLEGVSFGVRRRFCTIADGVNLLANVDKTHEWCPSDDVLSFGDLQKVPPQFVPPDSTKEFPWNRILKNNFWNGSYVFEWSDAKKLALDPFFADPRLLQELARKVHELIPIDLAALSDRLGNLVVQLPVTAIMSKFTPTSDGGCIINVAWHSQITPRPLQAMCRYEFDGVLTGLALGKLRQPETKLQTSAKRGTFSAIIWDEENGIVLSQSGPTDFIEQILLNVSPIGSEPRTISFSDRSGNKIHNKISVMGGGPAMLIGNPHGDDNGGRTRDRLYRAQIEQLESRKEFISYGAGKCDSIKERKRAINDLIELMRRHGRVGTWLWDPYLDAYDILETLIHCPYAGSEMRALSGAESAPRERNADQVDLLNNNGEKQPTGKKLFIQNQQNILNSVDSNWRGVRIEFRARHGNIGWGFHDRFIIFPQDEGPAIAWSLGTSINSFGYKHHILQKVSDGQLIMDAFKDLWDQLAGPEYLIWKKP